MKGWRDVSARVPCVGCGRHDWCQVSDDGEVYACHREPSNAPRVNAAGEVWLHFTGSGPRIPRPRPELPPPPPCADDATRDRVYRALLGVLDISDDHRAGLVARGLTTEQVERGGYATMPAPSERPAVLRRLRAALDGDIPVDVPGIHAGKLLGAVGLAIPVRDHEGQVVAIKVRADSAEHGKYLWLSSVRQKGPGPGAPCHVPAWRRSREVVRVTEGPLKADVATRLGQVLTVGVPGVTAVRSAVPALRALGARLVVLAWDSDARTNAHVGRSLARAVEVFREEGFAVAVETWAPEHKGLDDALAAGAVIVRHEGDDVDGVVREIVGVTEPVVVEGSAGDDWRKCLTCGKSGQPRNTFGNLCLYLQHVYGERIRYNEMILQPEWREDGAWRPTDDGVVGRVRVDLEREHGIEAAVDNIRLALRTVADGLRVHPVREYLRGLSWDRAPRLCDLGPRVLGSKADELTARKLTAFMVSAVARAYQPGAQVDTVLVLVGPQGARKSTFFRVLAGDYFADSHMDLTNKDAYLQMRSTWIYEWGEVEKITATRRAEEIKAFLTSPHDTFRPPYGHAVTQVARSNVFVGTTNDDRFLSDDTGNRRWWPVMVTRTVDVGLLMRDRDQLWAEAVALYQSGYQWWLTPEEAAAHEDHVERHRVVDPWEDTVGAWLSREWAALKARDSIKYLTTHIVLTKALGLTPKDMRSADVNRLSKVLRRMGMEPRRVRLTPGEIAAWMRLTGTTRDRIWSWERREDGDALDSEEGMSEGDNDFPN
jgi:hypothetical protein